MSTQDREALAAAQSRAKQVKGTETIAESTEHGMEVDELERELSGIV